MTQQQVDKDIDNRINHFLTTLPTLATSTYNKLQKILGTPAKLKQWIPLIFNQMSLIVQNNDCSKIFVEIVVLLGTWPMRLGYSKEWIYYVDMAHNLSLSQNLDVNFAYVFLLKSKTMFDQGNFNESLILAEKGFLIGKSKKLPRELATTLSHMTTILLLQKKTTEALSMIDDLQVNLIVLDSNDKLAHLYLHLAKVQVYRKTGWMDKIRNLVDHFEHTFIHEVDRRSLGVWHHNIGLFEWYLGNHRSAIERYKLAKHLFALTADKGEIGITAEIALSLWNMGELKQAETYMLDAKEKAEATLDYLRILKIYSNLALIYLSEGRISEAYKINEESLTKAIHIRHMADIVRLTGNRGIIQIHQENYTDALSDLEYDFSNTNEQNQQLACTLANLSRVHRLMGDRNKALDCANKALELSENKNYRARIIIALRSLAECIIDVKEAKVLFERALNLAKDNQKLDEAACYLSISSIESDNMELKKEFWAMGVKLLEEINADLWLVGKSPESPPLIPLLG